MQGWASCLATTPSARANREVPANVNKSALIRSGGWAGYRELTRIDLGAGVKA
jgi:hypothetical protein